MRDWLDATTSYVQKMRSNRLPLHLHDGVRAHSKCVVASSSNKSVFHSPHLCCKPLDSNEPSTTKQISRLLVSPLAHRRRPTSWQDDQRHVVGRGKRCPHKGSELTTLEVLRPSLYSMSRPEQGPESKQSTNTRGQVAQHRHDGFVLPLVNNKTKSSFVGIAHSTNL